MTGGPRDAPERQRTLRATLEWSYSLLDDDERRLFARLAVFSGGCSLDAAEQVVDADLDRLQSLVEKNLLRHSEERFWMLETIREYAVELHERSGENDDLAARHAAFFADLIAEADRLHDRPEAKLMRHRVAADAANVVAATRWAHESGSAELLLQLAIGGKALSLPPRPSAAWVDDALSRWSGPPAPLLARGYRNAAGLHFLLEQFELARARVEVAGIALPRARRSRRRGDGAETARNRARRFR